MKHRHPFRGETPLTLKERLRKARYKRKLDAEDRQKRGSRGFAHMLLYWNTPFFDDHTMGRWFWIICTQDSPLRRVKPCHCKRPNLAQERAYDLPF